jgi:hypothetical protein
LCTWGGGGGGGGRYLYSRRVSNISGHQRPVSSPSYLAVWPKLVESWVALLGFNLYFGSIAVLLFFKHFHGLFLGFAHRRKNLLLRDLLSIICVPPHYFRFEEDECMFLTKNNEHS